MSFPLQGRVSPAGRRSSPDGAADWSGLTFCLVIGPIRPIAKDRNGSARLGAAMPLPRRLAAFNARVTNRLTGPFAAWLPGFAVVEHVGRRSGRPYRTPVNLFHDGERYVIALTYGQQSEWVQNVLAAGGCTVRTRGKRITVGSPDVFVDRRRRVVPWPVRRVLGLLDVTEFLALDLAQPRRAR